MQKKLHATGTNWLIDELVSAITPGQLAAFYIQEEKTIGLLEKDGLTRWLTKG